MFLKFFYPRINKPNIHNDIIDFSNFQNGLHNLFSSTGFYFKIKVLEGSHMEKILLFFCFLIFEQFFSKCTFLRMSFFFTWWLSNQLNFFSGCKYL